MLKVKRKLPPSLLDAEKQIEHWRSSLLTSIHQRIDVSIYLLVSVTCELINYVVNNATHFNTFDAIEIFVRANLAGLEFALSGLEGPLPSGKFDKHLIASILSNQDKVRALKVVKHMHDYSLVRDAFLTYGWGGYEIENSTKDVLRFVNPPNWIGRRDRAQQVITQEIKAEQVSSIKYPPTSSLRQQLEQQVEVLPSLSLNNLSSRQFASAWIGLILDIFRPNLITGEVPIIEENDLIKRVQGTANFSTCEAKEFIRLIIFDRERREPLTLFHCPLVKVTTSSLLAVLPGFSFGNPNVTFPRLVVHRGQGLNTFATRIEKHLLEKIKNHFSTNEVMINTCVPYSGTNDKGDIDLIVYEPVSNRLLIGQVKGFIPPDSVEEVIRANEALEEGLQQVERVQRWFGSVDRSTLAHTLKLHLPSTSPEVYFVLIGNGFSGSDYLPIPKDIAVADATYLLLPRLKGASIFDAINEYKNRLSRETAKVSEMSGFNSVKLGNTTVYIPA